MYVYVYININQFFLRLTGLFSMSDWNSKVMAVALLGIGCYGLYKYIETNSQNQVLMKQIKKKEKE